MFGKVSRTLVFGRGVGTFFELWTLVFVFLRLVSILIGIDGAGGGARGAAKAGTVGIGLFAFTAIE